MTFISMSIGRSLGGSISRSIASSIASLKLNRIALGALFGIPFSSGFLSAEEEFLDVTDPQVIQSVDAIVAQDAQSWVFNHYNAGSMSNVKYQELATGSDSKKVIFYGEYVYNNANTGWVKMQVTQANDVISVDCIEFWDFRGQCRPLGRSPSQAMMGGIVQAIAVDIATTPVGSTSTAGEDADADAGARIYREGEDRIRAQSCASGNSLC